MNIIHTLTRARRCCACAHRLTQTSTSSLVSLVRRALACRAAARSAAYPRVLHVRPGARSICTVLSGVTSDADTG